MELHDVTPEEHVGKLSPQFCLYLATDERKTTALMPSAKSSCVGRRWQWPPTTGIPKRYSRNRISPTSMNVSISKPSTTGPNRDLLTLPIRNTSSIPRWVSNQAFQTTFVYGEIKCWLLWWNRACFPRWFAWLAWIVGGGGGIYSTGSCFRGGVSGWFGSKHISIPVHR